MTLKKATENENWEEQFAKLPLVIIDIDTKWSELRRCLNSEQLERMRPKLEMVKEAANLMARAMVKGTLKYPIDDWNLVVWEDHGLDDLVDVLNYRMLERAARRGK